MMNRSSVTVLIGSLFLASGCGIKYSVTVLHILPDNPANVEQYKLIQKTYLLVNTPAYPDSNSKRGYFYVNSHKLADYVNKNLFLYGGSVYAYRVISEHADSDHFAHYLKPTAVAEAKFDYADLSHYTTSKQVTEIDYEGNKKTVYKKETAYSGIMSGTAALYTYPENKNIVSKAFIAKFDTKILADYSESQENKLWEALYRQAAQQISAIISPQVVYRRRPLFRPASDANAQKGFKYAVRGNFEKSDPIWQRRLESGRGNWKDKMNLAASAESRRKYESALAYYHEAEQESAGSEEIKGVDWQSIYRDIKTSLITKKDAVPVPGADDWFTRRIAVLPFSDETVEIDGPPLIRKAVYEILYENGYTVVTLEEVDNILRNNGFTQGGQLGATTPDKIAGWLNADSLIFGHIEDFNKINIGIYVKKSIEGKLRLWDRSEKREIWSSSIPVKVHSFPSEASKGGVLIHFLGNLAGSLVESMVDKPMIAEAYKFAVRNIDGLPMSPIKKTIPGKKK